MVVAISYFIRGTNLGMVVAILHFIRGIKLDMLVAISYVMMVTILVYFGGHLLCY